MQRHAASARSEAAECRELQQLLSIYFHWGSVFGIHSSPSELLLGPPGQDLLFHPPVHPPIRVHLPLCPEVRSVRICTSEGQTHYFRSSDLSTFFFLVFLSFPPISVLLISSPEELLLNSAVTGESPCRCFLVRRNPRNIEAWKRSDLWSGQEVWYISSWGNPFKEARVSWGEVESHGGKVYPMCCWDCFKLTWTIA